MKQISLKKFVVTICLILSFIIVTGCQEQYSSEYRYSIDIYGINGYTGENVTVILVPMPMIGSTPVMNETDLRAFNENGAGKGSDMWTMGVERTEYGDMLSFRTNNSTLTNISYERIIHLSNYETPMSERRRVTMQVLPCPLSPRKADDKFDLEGWAKRGELPDYTTYIFIRGIKSPETEEKSIKILESILYYEGSKTDHLFSTEYGNGFNIEVYEEIPKNFSGWRPVVVHCEKQG